MDMVTQDAYHRQRMIAYFHKHGGTKTSIRYKVSRKTVYKWAGRYDGTLESLKDSSHRPHSHPRQHTEEEIGLIQRHIKRSGRKDLLLTYQRLREKGYARHYGSFKRLVSRLYGPAKPKKVKKKPKPYQRAEYPGQKVQVDVKYVPSRCVVNGQKYYQFTAVDECTRTAFREMYDEHSTFSAKDFLMKLVVNPKFPIRMVQTDNGTEFTNALLVIKAKHKTLFEQALEDMGILYHRIRIATPRHNGKVERQHRTDEERFYSKMRMYDLADGRKQLASYQAKSNDHIKTCLNFRSPNQVLNDYLAVI
jgi:transposase InsO family protein